MVTTPEVMRHADRLETWARHGKVGIQMPASEVIEILVVAEFERDPSTAPKEKVKEIRGRAHSLIIEPKMRP